MNARVKQFLALNQGQEITKQEGHLSYLIYGSSIPGIGRLKDYYSLFIGSLTFSANAKRGICFFSLEQYRNITLEAFQQLMERYDRVDDLPEVKDFMACEKVVETFYRNAHPDKLARQSESDIVAVLSQAFDYVHQLLATTLFTEGLDDQVMNQLTPSEQIRELSLLNTALSMLMRRLALMLGSNNHDSYGLQWLGCDYAIAPPLNNVATLIEKYRDEAGGEKVIRENLKKEEEKIVRNKETLKLFGDRLQPQERKILDFIHQSSYIRDKRNDSIYKASTVISNCARLLFERLGLPSELIPFSFYHDFQNGGYNSPRYLEDLERRRSGSVLFYVYPDSCAIIEDPNGEILNELNQLLGDRLVDSMILKGSVASPGVAKGSVVVVHDESDFHKFNDSNILVTSMTRPEFVPLMRKAVAIITDEGGVTCHAAIVSRELHKPCIIGTKNATRLLYDGDIVEVDATNGTVKKINDSTSPNR